MIHSAKPKLCTHWTTHLPYLQALAITIVSPPSMTWFSIKWNHVTFVLWLCRCVLSHVCLFVTPWTVACQAPLPMEFSRQEYWSGLPFPCPGDLPNPGIEPMSLVPPALAVGFFTTSATWEARPVTGLFIYPPGPSMLLQMARFIFFCFFKTEWCSLVNTYHIYFNPFIRWWTLRQFCIVAVLWRLLCSEHGTIGIKSLRMQQKQCQD